MPNPRIVIALAIAAASATAWTPALAQAPAAAPGAQKQESIKAVVRKNNAPVSSEVLRVKLPRPVERKLKNGLRVLIFENHRVPAVSFDLVLPASTLSDPEGLPGVAEATADMIKQGTKNRDAKRISQELSELGASANAYAGWGARTTHLNASALTESLDPLLDIAADILIRPAFPDEELAKWKKRKLAQLQQMRSQPFFLADEMFLRVMYPNDARAIGSTTPQSLEKMSRADLAAFHKQHYVPGSALLGVTGDVTPDEITAKLEKVFAEWEAGTAADPDLKRVAPIADKKVYLVNRPNSVQTYLTLGNHGVIDVPHPDYPAVMVMNRILGAGPTSRLFMRIREELGYTYGVGSSFRAQKYLDDFRASSSVRTEVTGPALDEFLAAFRRIREEPVPKDDLDNAKRAIVAGFALGLESQQSTLYQTLTLYELGLPADFWDRYPERIMAVTAEDVARVAKKYVPLDNVQLVAVGDATKIRELLKKYGPVEEYDAEGRKVQ